MLTLAFTGFPPALEELKEALSAHHGAALPPENPGSRWPKSSLGCLANGRRLNPEELARLHAVCTAHSVVLPAAQPVVVEDLQLTLFACRSLERVVARQTLELGIDEDAERRVLDDELPSKAAAAAAAATLAEFAPERLATYWVDVARDGGREEHYRGDARGATLVAPLRDTYAAELAAFRAAVDAALPGAYVWFADESLHITVRALI